MAEHPVTLQCPIMSITAPQQDLPRLTTLPVESSAGSATSRILHGISVLPSEEQAELAALSIFPTTPFGAMAQNKCHGHVRSECKSCWTLNSTEKITSAEQQSWPNLLNKAIG